PSAVDANDTATRAGDHLVVDGVEHIGPVLCGWLTVRTWAEQRRGVAFTHVGFAGTQVDDELVHANAPNVGPQPAVDQHADLAAQPAEHAVGVTDRHQRQRGVAVGHPGVAVGHAFAGAN